MTISSAPTVKACLFLCLMQFDEYSVQHLWHEQTLLNSQSVCTCLRHSEPDRKEKESG